jgi:hypothetical protein
MEEKKRRSPVVDPQEVIRDLEDSAATDNADPLLALRALVWAAALPPLSLRLKEDEWWMLLGTLQNFRECAMTHDPISPFKLIAVAELGLTLSWNLRSLPSCRRMRSTSEAALKQWCVGQTPSISASLESLAAARLTLGSLVRCRLLMEASARGERSKNETTRKNRRSIGKAWEATLYQVGAELTGWIAGITRSNGTQALTAATKKDVRDDLGEQGLLMRAAEFDHDTLAPAIQSALGATPSQKGLAWQVNLPEAMLHDDDVKVACMLPEWDVRRGRMFVRYRGREIDFELLAGKSVLISGALETEVRVNDKVLHGDDTWEVACEYTDDDVHYLELEQSLAQGFALQRQFILFREDRCVMLADAVVKSKPDLAKQANRTDQIDYQLRLPLGQRISVQSDEAVHELFLTDSKRRAMIFPLSLDEWRGGPQRGGLRPTDDGHLVMQRRGVHQLYAPLWFDFSRGRFNQKRTWRTLTVGQDLQPVPNSIATAFRIQVGREQWLLYRSLADRVPRTFFGKQMIAGFYAARFDASEQTYEDLITVEDNTTETNSAPK